MSQLILEGAQIAAGFVPVDMQTAGNNGDYVSMANYERMVCVLYKAIGTGGDDPTITLQQATDASGTGAKDLDFTTIYKKQGADLALVGQWTKVTQTAANTYTNDTAAEQAAIWAVEFKADDLDADGGFKFLRMTVADIGGNPQLGCSLYIAMGARYQDAPENMRSIIA